MSCFDGLFNNVAYLLKFYCSIDSIGNGRLYVISLIHFDFLNRSDADTNKVYVYDGHGTNTHLHIFEKLHTKPVVIIKVNENLV